MSRSPALDPSEEQLLSDVESGAMHSVATIELLSQLQDAARRTGSKDQRINIRLSSADLRGLRTRALDALNEIQRREQWSLGGSLGA